MAVDMFIKIGDIKGEAKDAKHKDEIDVLAWSWGLSNPGSAVRGGGGRAGKPAIQDLSFTKFIDLASAHLALACAEGTFHDEAVLTCRKAGGDTGIQVEYLIIKMKKVLVTSFSAEGTSGDEGADSENVTLNFQTIQWKYTEQQEDGTPGRTSEMGWDLKANEKV